MAIPVVDLSEFLEESNESKYDFARKLGFAYEEVGFVSVKNHGIPREVITQLYECIQEFFSLPLKNKLQYEVPGLAGQRGYTRFGEEHAKGSDKPDLKEFFQFGQNVEDGNPLNNEYPANVVVNEIEGFNDTLYRAYKYFQNSGIAILRAIALYLGLNANYFDNYVHDGNGILRCIHYPPITSEPEKAIRAEQHEDINLITLLVGASAEGLEILSNQRKWEAVVSLPEQIVVNVGDMLQRLTNNRLRSTTHRVVNPRKEQWSISRYSIPFFLHPKSSMSLAGLPNCIDDTHPKRYSDITAGEYLDERLREIGLKK